MDNLIISFMIIGVLGVGAQWFAWRLNLPAIVLMSLAGLLVGPMTGLIQPEQDFGEFYRPIIAVAVAVILFEGGLSLRFDEIKGSVSTGVMRLVFPGVPVAWALGAIACHYIAGLSWQVSVLFAGILVVTGPTVIMPLLRQARLSQRPSAVLKWEGIINDPIGALLAVIVYEYVTLQETGHSTGEVAGSLILGTILSVGLGILMGYYTAVIFRRGWVPEYLKPPVLLAFVLVCFELPNLVQEEAGLLSVTAMGVTMANTKMPSINQLRHFKENIAVLFVSGVFVILTANLDVATIKAAANPQTLLFVAAMLFIVRPASVLLSTIGTDLKMSERALVAWIAPRGIVAVAVSSFFAAKLVEHGFPDAEQMIPLAFAMVFVTVVLHGFTMAPFGKMLGLASRAKPGVLIVGASNWSVALAKKISDLDIPVVVADDSWRALRRARQAGIETYYGEILSEVTEHHIDLNRYGYLLAVGANEAHNSLVCTDLAPEMGRAQIFQINSRGREENERRSMSFALQGQTLLKSATGLDELIKRQYSGWTFQTTKLTQAYPPDTYLEDIGEGEIVLVLRRDGLQVATAYHDIKLEAGDTVVAYVPPDVARAKSGELKSKKPEPSDAVREIAARKEQVLKKMPQPTKPSKKTT
jgi:NhaP-type Na+/H+ or K+/H+ antiporter